MAHPFSSLSVIIIVIFLVGWEYEQFYFFHQIEKLQHSIVGVMDLSYTANNARMNELRQVRAQSKWEYFQKFHNFKMVINYSSGDLLYCPLGLRTIFSFVDEFIISIQFYNYPAQRSNETYIIVRWIHSFYSFSDYEIYSSNEIKPDCIFFNFLTYADNKV